MGEVTLKPRDRRAQKNRQRILDAALDLIAEGGLDRLSLRKIALRSDYSPAALYEYFDSKEAIIDVLCLQVDALLTKYLVQADPTLDPAAGLVEIGMRYIDFAIDNPREYQLLLIHRLSAADVQQDKPAGSYAVLTDAVGRLDELPPSLSAPAFTYACWSFVHGLASLRNYLGDSGDLDFSSVQRAALCRFIVTDDGDS